MLSQSNLERLREAIVRKNALEPPTVEAIRPEIRTDMNFRIKKYKATPKIKKSEFEEAATAAK